jgi:hypothetical protein
VLKTLGRITPFACAVAGLMPMAAQAADAGACEAYAKAAVEQVAIGRAHPACVKGMQGIRWSPAFRVHFSYCMTRSAPELDSQRGARTQFLHACGAT